MPTWRDHRDYAALPTGPCRCKHGGTCARAPPRGIIEDAALRNRTWDPRRRHRPQEPLRLQVEARHRGGCTLLHGLRDGQARRRRPQGVPAPCRPYCAHGRSAAPAPQPRASHVSSSGARRLSGSRDGARRGLTVSPRPSVVAPRRPPRRGGLVPLRQPGETQRRGAERISTHPEQSRHRVRPGALALPSPSSP